MTEFRGRYFGFLALLCVTWVAARIGFLAIVPDLPNATAQESQANANPAAQTGIVEIPGKEIALPMPPACCHEQPRAGAALVAAAGKVLLDVHIPQQKAPTDLVQANRNALSAVAQSGFGQMLAQPPISADRGRRAQFYAYSFWREGVQVGGLNSGTQYGGSQSGFVATYALSRFGSAQQEQKLALILRGAIAHDNLREREIAAGLRWRPLQHLPLTLNAERRFRANRPDAVAAYVAGGLSEVKLPIEFRFEAFGQAGVVSGKDAGPFFDFLARTDRKVVEVGNAKFSAGAGMWGGGQDNVRRFDIGPSLVTDFRLGAVDFRASADWRFRVAGQANPANGPAVTLSTSF